MDANRPTPTLMKNGMQHDHAESPGVARQVPVSTQDPHVAEMVANRHVSLQEVNADITRLQHKVENLFSDNVLLETEVEKLSDYGHSLYHYCLGQQKELKENKDACELRLNAAEKQIQVKDQELSHLKIQNEQESKAYQEAIKMLELSLTQSEAEQSRPDKDINARDSKIEHLEEKLEEEMRERVRMTEEKHGLEDELAEARSLLKAMESPTVTRKRRRTRQ